jgi:addiction module HigA family antidote
MITLPGVDPQMIANNLTPFEPTHPGEVLKEEIEFRGLSKRLLAEQMGISYSTLNSMLNCKHPVTTEYALLFEAALGIGANLFVGLQTRYDEQVARQNKTFAIRLAKLREISVTFQQPTFTSSNSSSRRMRAVTA